MKRIKRIAAIVTVTAVAIAAIILGGCAQNAESEDEKYVVSPPAESDGVDETHKHTAKHNPGRGATCTEEGKTEYWYCSGCGKYFADEKLTAEITAEAIKIVAKGHTAVKDEAVEAGCEETGLTEGSHCNDCGAVLKAQEETKAGGHEYENGKCTRCGKRRESEGLEYIVTDGGYAVNGLGGCTDEAVIIPETYDGKPVTAIAQNAFLKNKNIKAIFLSKNIRLIGKNAFGDCTSLQTVEAGEGLKEIGDSAFSGCVNLKEFLFPAGLEEIGEGAFGGTGLKEVSLPAGMTEIKSGAFAGCENLVKITLPESILAISEDAFFGSGLTELEYRGTASKWANVAGAEIFQDIVKFLDG